MAFQTQGKKAFNVPKFSAWGLKIYACVAMVLANFGIIIVEHGIIKIDTYTKEGLSQALADSSSLMVWSGVGSVLQLIGGLAVPVFAFLLVEGFHKTQNLRKYFFSIAALAAVSEIPYDYAMSGNVWDISSQSAAFSLFVCFVMLYCMKVVKNKFLQFFVATAAVVWITLFKGEYGLCMVLLCAIFYMFREKNGVKTILGMIVSLLYVTGPISFYGIYFYTGYREYKCSKYVFYALYPIHLVVFGLITRLLL